MWKYEDAREDHKAGGVDSLTTQKDKVNLFRAQVWTELKLEMKLTYIFSAQCLHLGSQLVPCSCHPKTGQSHHHSRKSQGTKERTWLQKEN